MKKLLLLLIFMPVFFSAMDLDRICRAVTISAKEGVYYSTPTTIKSHEFYSPEKYEILYIDSDGDIFLRGKWIGWDGRLGELSR